MASISLHRYSLADYLALEEASNTRHEYLDGEIYAMAGGTPEHAALAVAVAASLLAQLRGRCRVYSSDLRVRVVKTGLVTYPDVTVVCGVLELDPTSPTMVVNPTVVVEVLSSGTEQYDRVVKFDHYRSIPSLRAVVLVSHDDTAIEVRERQDDGTWSSHVTGAGGDAGITSLAAQLSVNEIYAAARPPARDSGSMP